MITENSYSPETSNFIGGNNSPLTEETQIWLESDQQKLEDNKGKVLAAPPTRTFRWTLKNPSPQTQADCQGFQQYLQDLVQRNLLTPRATKEHYRYLRILLFDAEKQHAQNSEWPVELVGLFSDPKWIWRWLNKAENYDINKAGHILTQSTISRRINTIHHLWLWLKSENRVTETYIKELKELLRTKGDARIHLPKRKIQITEPLSEVEEQAIFDCIERYSPNPILRLRDRAMIITALETTMPLGKLNQMRIENIKKVEEDIWIYEFCDDSLVNEFTSPTINSPGMEQTWYISPLALASIEHYLHATGRDWSSIGPVWLKNQNTPLSIDNQSKLISRWMKKAGCRSTHCHVLRLSGIDRLLNKYKMAPSIVQAITNSSNLGHLLYKYGKRTTTNTVPIEEE